MARARLPLLIAIATLLSAVPVAAQRITSPYHFLDTHQYISLFGGKLSTQTGTLGLGPQSGNLYGGRLGYRPGTGPLALELTLAVAPLQRTVLDTLRTSDSTFARFGTASQGLLLTLVDARFNLTGARTWHGFQPFIVLGTGAVWGTNGANGADRLVPAPSRFKFGTSFAAEGGIGAEWYATPHVGLRVDGRGTLWKVKVPTAFQAQKPTLGGSEWTKNYSLAGSLAYHF